MKPIQQNETVHQTSPNLKTNTSQKEEKNRKSIEKTLPPGQKEKFEHKESSRLRSQPRKSYKTFIPQTKITKKVEF